MVVVPVPEGYPEGHGDPESTNPMGRGQAVMDRTLSTGKEHDLFRSSSTKFWDSCACTTSRVTCSS